MIELMRYCNNYFKHSLECNAPILENKTIKNVRGKYLKGQYILIKGTILNDGLYQVVEFKDNTITVDRDLNSEFSPCSIYGLKVPFDFLEVVKQYKEYKTTHKDDTNVISENFEGYSYTKATNESGRPLTALEVFKDKLKPFRKMYDSDFSVKVAF